LKEKVSGVKQLYSSLDKHEIIELLRKLVEKRE